MCVDVVFAIRLTQDYRPLFVQAVMLAIYIFLGVSTTRHMERRLLARVWQAEMSVEDELCYCFIARSVRGILCPQLLPKNFHVRGGCLPGAACDPLVLRNIFRAAGPAGRCGLSPRGAQEAACE